jgi:hypothetical protein
MMNKTTSHLLRHRAADTFAARLLAFITPEGKTRTELRLQVQCASTAEYDAVLASLCDVGLIGLRYERRGRRGTKVEIWFRLPEEAAEQGKAT